MDRAAAFSSLIEIVLRSVFAQRFSTPIEWDTNVGQIANHPDFNAIAKNPLVKDGGLE